MLKNFKTYQLATEFYQKCQVLKLRKHEIDQLLRASLSVVLNLAEGSAKPTAKDRRKYYAIALGSLRECQALLQVTNQNGLDSLSDQLGACLFVLSRPPH